MTIIARAHQERNRFFIGYNATVAFEVNDDSGLAWCFNCVQFHHYTGMSSADVKTTCPKIPNGAKTLILFCGAAPIAIRRAALVGKLDREARQALNAMLGVLDVLISSEGLKP